MRLADAARTLRDAPPGSGATVLCRPHGRSMTPRVRDGALVRIAQPTADPEVGDVVLCTVRGQIMLHLVTATDPVKRRCQISNNHGHVNGWTSYSKIWGKAEV